MSTISATPNMSLKCARIYSKLFHVNGIHIIIFTKLSLIQLKLNFKHSNEQYKRRFLTLFDAVRMNHGLNISVKGFVIFFKIQLFLNRLRYMHICLKLIELFKERVWLKPSLISIKSNPCCVKCILFISLYLIWWICTWSVQSFNIIFAVISEKNISEMNSNIFVNALNVTSKL